MANEQKLTFFPDYSQFKAGDTFVATISSVRDQSTFFVVKDEDLQKCKFSNGELENLEDMFWTPSINECFIVIIDGIAMRAVRLSYHEQPNSKLNAYLMDTGEKLEFDFDILAKFEIYAMPENMSDVPGLALKCRLNANQSDPEHNESFLEDNLDEKFKLVVNSVVENELIIDLHRFVTIDLDEISENNENLDVLVRGHGVNLENICPFHDPKIKGCFKNSSCKMIHAEKIDEKNLSNEQEVSYFFKMRGNITNPAVGSKFHVKITSVQNSNRIVCILAGAQDELDEFVKTMNAHENVYTPMKNDYPAFHELVIVKMNGKFFRARVENENFDVFLLDIGTFIKFSDFDESFFSWNLMFDDTPFFAYEMEIANILPSFNARNAKAVYDMIMDYQDLVEEESEAFYQVEIVDNLPLLADDDIKCLLKFDNTDIGGSLVDSELAEKSINFSYYTNSSHEVKRG